MNKANRPGPKRVSKYLTFTGYLVVVILINIVVSRIPPLSLDLTANHIFSISKASKSAVKALEDNLTIKVFFTKNLPAPSNNVEQFIKDILAAYSQQAGSKYFNTEFIDVGGDEGEPNAKVQKNRELAGDYGVSPIQLQVIKSDNAAFTLAYMAMVFIHGDLTEVISPIQSTSGLEYRITSTIQKLTNKISKLLAVKENIKVKMFFSSELFRLMGSEKLKTTVPEIVKKLNTMNYDKLDFVYYDPSTDKAAADDAAARNAYSVTNNKDKLYADIYVEYGGKSQRVPILEIVQSFFGASVSVTPDDQLETLLNDSITGLLNINDKVGYVTTNTLPLADGEMNQYLPQEQQVKGLTNFKAILDETYGVENVNLDEVIPQSFNTMIIAGPADNFTDYQLYQIDQFLMQGKSLAIFLDGLKVEQPANNPQYGYAPPTVKPLTTGLEGLLESYGVSVRNKWIFDENCLTQVQQGQGKVTYYPLPMIQNQKINNKLPFINNIMGIVGYYNAPLALKEDIVKSNNIKTSVLFSSSNKSWETDDIAQSLQAIQVPSDPALLKSFPLAYVLEGKFKSYYTGKPIPEKPVKEEKAEDVKKDTAAIKSKDVKAESRFVSQGESGKIFLIGSSKMIENDLFNENFNPNRLLVLNIFDFLNNKTDNAVMRSKLQQYNPLNNPGDVYKTIIKIVCQWVITALVIFAGVIVYLKRRARKAQLQQLFSKTKSNTNLDKV